MAGQEKVLTNKADKPFRISEGCKTEPINPHRINNIYHAKSEPISPLESATAREQSR